MTNVNINGHTTVRVGANLVLHASTLNGNLVVQADGFVNAVGTSVAGATRLNTAFGVFTENSTLGGNAVVNGPGFFFSLGSALQGVTSTNGETFLESARLARGLSTTGDLFTDVFDSVIRGAVNISGASLGSIICVSEVDGNASVSASAGGEGGVVQIGAAAPLAGCGFNVFAANVAMTDNTGPSFVSDNVIRGTLACTGNTPATVGSSDRIRGGATGQCAPVPADPAAAKESAAKDSAATADGDALAHKAGLMAKVLSRTTEGATEADAAGRALLIPGR